LRESPKLTYQRNALEFNI